MSQVEEKQLQYTDKIIYLDNGSMLLGRIIMNANGDDTFITVFKPMELFVDDEGNQYLRTWIPESNDEFFFIPSSKILTISTPEPVVYKSFLEILNPENSDISYH